jgi:hypothetical protein
MTSSPHPQEVHEALELLGNTPQQVAQSLVNKGIALECTDNMNRTSNCPIARYLAEQFPRTTFGVSAKHIVITPSLATCKVVVCPRPVQIFVAFFDEVDPNASVEKFPDE